MKKREINVRDLQVEYLEKVIEEFKRAIDPNTHSEEFLRSRFYEKYEKYLQPKFVQVYDESRGNNTIEVTFKYDPSCNHRRGHLFVFSYQVNYESDLGWVFYRTPQAEFKISFEVQSLTPESILSMIDELSAMEVLDF